MGFEHPGDCRGGLLKDIGRYRRIDQQFPRMVNGPTADPFGGSEHARADGPPTLIDGANAYCATLNCLTGHTLSEPMQFPQPDRKRITAPRRLKAPFNKAEYQQHLKPQFIFKDILPFLLPTRRG